LLQVLSSLWSYFAGLEGLVAILFVLGIALVIIELVMPGFGLAGTLGIISLVAGVVLVYPLVSPPVLALIIATILLIIVGMLVYMYKSAVKGGRISKLLLLNTRTGKEEGFSSTNDNKDLIGLEGRAETVLRPAGTGEFNGKKYDVVTDGEFIEKGSRIKIIDVEGFRIVVKKLD